jgi:hypothetical protein
MSKLFAIPSASHSPNTADAIVRLHWQTFYTAFVRQGRISVRAPYSFVSLFPYTPYIYPSNYLSDINRLKRHSAEAIYFTVYIMISIGELYVLHFGARLNGLGRTLYW